MMNPQEVREHLAKDQNGKPYPSISNCLLVFQHDNYFEKVFFDTMREAPIIVSDLHNRRLWTDTDVARTHMHFEQKYGISSKINIGEAFKVLCDERKYNPVQKIIESIKWDGTKRCEEFFIKWAKSPDDEYSRECGRLFFAQGIERAFSPGSKCDYVVVMQGDQGNAKSTLAKWLAIEPEFFLSLASIAGKDERQQLCGKWIVELEELLATIDGKASAEKSKQFISADTDNFRPPYGHYPIDHKRSVVFIGTTNRKKFLSDLTGNRRWFPLDNNQDGEFLYQHEAECKADILQAWAEMLHYWRNKDQKSASIPNKSLNDVIENRRFIAEEDDPSIGLIIDFLRHKEKVCIAQVSEQALSMDWRKLSKQQRDKISAVLTGQRIGCTIKMTQSGKNPSAERFKGYGTQQAYIVPDWLRNWNDDDEAPSEL